MNEFGEYLKELRAGRSLREMERITGLSHTYLSTLEKGVDPRSGNERKPTPEALKKLSDSLGVSYSELMSKAGYVEEESDIERIDWAIKIVESNLYKKIRDKEVLMEHDGKLHQTLEEEEYLKENERYNLLMEDNTNFIEEFKKNLKTLKKLRQEVENGATVENLPMLLYALKNPEYLWNLDSLRRNSFIELNELKEESERLKIEIEHCEDIENLKELKEQEIKLISKLNTAFKSVDNYDKQIMFFEYVRATTTDEVKNELLSNINNSVVNFELSDFINLDINLAIKGKVLTKEEKNKLLKMAETMFCE